MLGIDVSNYTGAIDAARAEALHAAGVRRAVVGTQYPAPPYPSGVAHAQIPALLDAGIEVQAYVYLWLAEDTAAQVRAAVQRLAPWQGRIARLWLDVEDTSAPAQSPPQRVQAVRAAVAACGPFAPGIYTGAWWWRPHTADTHAFAQLPLWVAQYDGERNLDFSPFGGWTRAAMKQYAGSATFAGVPHVDLDWYEEEILPLTEQEFGWAFAALYRGVDGVAFPLRIRWGERAVNAAGEQVHALIVGGRR